MMAPVRKIDKQKANMSLKGRAIFVSDGMGAIGAAIGLRGASDGAHAVIAREYLTAAELPGMTSAPAKGRFVTALTYEDNRSWPAVTTRKVE
jgi:hypothetical protein